MPEGEKYKVQAGDTIVKIAHARGFRSWLRIWNHDENKALREDRGHPHVLAPGDELFIPSKEVREFDCETSEHHVFRVRRLTQYIKQELVGEDGQPLANCRYELSFGGETREGKTNADGQVFEEVPIELEEAELRCYDAPDGEGEPLVWTLDLGHLDPVAEDAGALARLENLGYDRQGEGDSGGEETTAKLKEFQEEHGLEPSGELDDPTRAKLDELHDAEPATQD